jgi:selenocysteine lyase/cysteine desulfurase
MKLSRRQFMGAASTAATVSIAPLRLRAAGEDDPLGIRADFPVTSEGVYLNSAYIAAVPRPVAEAGCAFIDRKATKPISLGDMQAKADEVRRQFAKLVNATPEEIGFLYTTSEGENLVARSLELKPGDNVVIDELHYHAEFVLYSHLAESQGIDLRIVKHRNGAVDRSDFEPFVDAKTRLVSVAWVSHQNGFRHDLRPLADLAHAHGAYLYTDGIQAAGMFPLDVRAAGVDFMACGTYKWLLGSFGVAPFFVRRELLDRIPNDRWGALHVEQELGNNKFKIYQTAKKYEFATSAFGPIYVLGAGLSYLERVGVDRIETHTVALAAELWKGVADRKFKMLTPEGNRSSIVSFVHGKDPDVVKRVLDGAKIQVSFRERNEQLRVSPALFNNRGDIAAFLSAVDRLT